MRKDDMKDRRIALADCNNFFVSCERRVDTRLDGRPVVVLSGNDGCVISRSNEVKKWGFLWVPHTSSLKRCWRTTASPSAPQIINYIRAYRPRLCLS